MVPTSNFQLLSLLNLGGEGNVRVSEWTGKPHTRGQYIMLLAHALLCKIYKITTYIHKLTSLTSSTCAEMLSVRTYR